MEIVFYFTLVIPILLGLISTFFKKEKAKDMLGVQKYVYLFLAAISVYFWIEHSPLNSWIFVLDGINIVFYSVIFMLSFLISMYAESYFATEVEHKEIGRGRLRQYNISINLFIASMLVVAVSKNLMWMWVALEATTICTTFLISFYGTKSSWEAAWKYAILCGLGVTIGLFGLFMLLMAGVPDLDFTTLNPSLEVNQNMMKLAFVFILIGFGTKVGFFPLNSWLPDAHGKGSTPISAFMSSILLPLAFYVIIRAQGIIDVYLDPSFTSKMMIFFSLATIIYSGFVLIIQHHYKRALAYSSSENMGIIAFAWALGTPIAHVFALLHMVGHSFLKTASFMSAGNILLHTHTGQFASIKHLLKYMKHSGILLAVSLFLLVGLPPSPLFISEIGILWQAYTLNPWYAVAFIVGLVLAFSGLFLNFSSLYSDKDTQDLEVVSEDQTIGGLHLPIIASIVFSLIATAVFFLYFHF